VIGGGAGLTSVDWRWKVVDLYLLRPLEICDYKKSMITIFFSPLSFVAVFRSGIRDPGSRMGKNQDPG
jgi:hypothetical protein